MCDKNYLLMCSFISFLKSLIFKKECIKIKQKLLFSKKESIIYFSLKGSIITKKRVQSYLFKGKKESLIFPKEKVLFLVIRKTYKTKLCIGRSNIRYFRSNFSIFQINKTFRTLMASNFLQSYPNHSNFFLIIERI